MMLNLPDSTKYGIRIPKQKFYENLDISPKLKRLIVDQIVSVIWANKLAPSTMNISQGKEVTELEVFEIQLKERELDQAVLTLIDQQIPYHILHLLTYDGEVQAWISYKTTSAGTHAFKVNTYFHTDWQKSESIQLETVGLSTDAIYENWIRQIAGTKLSDDNPHLNDAIEKSKRREKLQKEIARLEKLAWAEKQPKRKMELAQRKRALQSELEAL